MLNDRDDKQNEHEESEYHFSDEDVSFEVEDEAAKPGGGAGLLSRLPRSRRMLMSIAVFVILVFIVYRMVSPGSEEAVTDITPQTVAETTVSQIPSASSAQSARQAAAPAQSAAPRQQAPQAEIAQPAQQTQQAARPQENSRQQPVVGMPSVIPVASSVPSAPAQSYAPGASGQTQMPAVLPEGNVQPQQQQQPVAPQPTAGNVDSAIVVMAATNEKLITQLQQEYAQRLSEFASQNKTLQDQVQTLNSRVAVMEAQLNKVVQSTTNTMKRQRPSIPSQVRPALPANPPVVENRTGYTVQAIIPGRAWLKSASGETLTVAEGDNIKGLGRVSKIDPYDGVVEINTGSKIISISYGNND